MLYHNSARVYLHLNNRTLELLRYISSTIQVCSRYIFFAFDFTSIRTNAFRHKAEIMIVVRQEK